MIFLTKREMRNDIYVKALCTKARSTEAVKPAVDLSGSGCCKSFVLVFVVSARLPPEVV